MIEQIFIIAFLVLSIHYTMQPDEIFGKLGDWLEDHLPDRVHPAVFACNVCMAPYYGSVLYWLIPWQHVLWQWPVVIIGAMGVNVVINKWAPEKETKQVDGVDITKWELPGEAPKPPFENINLTRDSE
jgi:hypothetical protein